MQVQLLDNSKKKYKLCLSKNCNINSSGGSTIGKDNPY